MSLVQGATSNPDHHSTDTGPLVIASARREVAPVGLAQDIRFPPPA